MIDMFTIEGEPLEATIAREKILKEFDDLEFQEEGHIYTLNGKTLRSASTIGHDFIVRPFDAEAMSIQCAQRRGGEPADYRLEWARNAFRAATAGTKTHAYGESLAYLRAGHPEKIVDLVRPQYSEELDYLAPISPKEEAVVKFLDDLPKSYHLVINEAKAYSGKNPDPSRNLKEQLCGTFDMLYYYDGEGNKDKAGFVIFDYKTNRDLYNSYNQENFVCLKAPFNDRIEEDLSLYTIQLSLYGLMLEDIGINIIGRRLIWLKDDGTYMKVSVDDVSEDLRRVL